MRRALVFFFFSSRRRHTRCSRDWSSDMCSSDLSVAEEDRADDIREAGRAAVLDRAFADSRLNDFEVQEAGHAVAASEDQTDRELAGEHAEDRPPPGEDREKRETPDDGLVRSRGACVDDIGVAIGIGLADHRRTSSNAWSEVRDARSTSHRAKRAWGSKPTSDGASVTKFDSALMS